MTVLFQQLKNATTDKEIAELLSKAYNMGWNDRDAGEPSKDEEIITTIADGLKI